VREETESVVCLLIKIDNHKLLSNTKGVATDIKSKGSKRLLQGNGKSSPTPWSLEKSLTTGEIRFI
jgi:hypothetical protein